MVIQLYCDETLISTFDGNREEVGAMLKSAGRSLGLNIDEEFELQNRLTVLFQNHGPKNLMYETKRVRFSLKAVEKVA